MKAYLLQHPETGRYMPVANNNKGYSQWNGEAPRARNWWVKFRRGGALRLFKSKRAASLGASYWNKLRKQYQIDKDPPKLSIVEIEIPDELGEADNWW